LKSKQLGDRPGGGEKKKKMNRPNGRALATCHYTKDASKGGRGAGPAKERISRHRKYNDRGISEFWGSLARGRGGQKRMRCESRYRHSSGGADGAAGKNKGRGRDPTKPGIVMELGPLGGGRQKGKGEFEQRQDHANMSTWVLPLTENTKKKEPPSRNRNRPVTARPIPAGPT